MIWIGDNGSPNGSRVGDYKGVGVKSTVYEGGIHVPMVIAGPLVDRPGRTSEALVNSADLFATIAEIAGIELSDAALELDSVSVLPLLTDADTPGRRQWAYGEMFEPNGPGPYDIEASAVRMDDFKLIRDLGVEQLYDLRGTLLEGDDLLLLTAEDDLDKPARQALRSMRLVYDRCIAS